MRHRFKIGDTVTFEPARSAQPAASTSYKVLRLLPVEYGVCRYRIKSAAEVYERVALERELGLRL